MCQLKAKTLMEENRQEQKAVYEQLDVRQVFGENEKIRTGQEEP